jgi:hypothetical protein
MFTPSVAAVEPHPLVEKLMEGPLSPAIQIQVRPLIFRFTQEFFAGRLSVKQTIESAAGAIRRATTGPEFLTRA